MTRAIVVMGVAGCGKSTLGRALAAALGWRFVEGDALHPPANLAKMAAGIPLDDADRRPFLEAVAAALAASSNGVVATCSALKRSYRDLLRARAGEILFVLPVVERAELARRLAARRGHYMPASLLESQLATLEPPLADERALRVDGTLPTAEQVAAVVAALRTPSPDSIVKGTAAMQDTACDIGLIGLAVMGENLALNIESHGYSVAVYNRTFAKTEAFVAGRGRDKRFVGARSLAALVASVTRPRKIVMLVKAGSAVDELVSELTPLLAPGDVLIDGGNSLYTDTIRRVRDAEARGLLYVGSGVSGGEEGALRGPSLMPGGSRAAWPLIRPIFQAIAARTPNGEPCCEWMGEDGAGHFVKMVHNGIEYGDMQIICETYDIMKRGLGMTNAEMANVFAEWNAAELDSYLIEITRDILAFRAPNGEETLDFILDAAGQKGTGKWTVNAALDAATPLTLIAEAVFARVLSAAKEERVAAAGALAQPTARVAGDRGQLVDDLRQALYAAKIVSYAQGYALMRAAAAAHAWSLDFGAIALTWRGGCIIRSAFLGDIKRAFDREPSLVNLMLDPFFKSALERCDAAWRRVAVAAVGAAIPIPCLTAALAYWDGYRSARLPANLLQAQRDYFGAHLYERIDRARGELFHTNWTGRGGATTSAAYSS